MSLRFDAYTATTQAIGHQQAAAILRGVAGAEQVTVHQSKGFHQFAERLAFKDATGVEFGAVQWGGRQGDWVMVEAKGERTPELVERLRSDVSHRCTRVDSCADFDAPRAFERLYRACRKVKKDHRIIGGKHGDWEDFPERGRTLYLGSTSSTTRVRLYEKGKQPEYAHLGRSDWARLEIQVRPEKAAKGAFSLLSAVDVWGASRWTRELAGAVLQEHVDPHPAGSMYRLTEQERALRWMVRQYGAHLVGLSEDLGGWDMVGRTLGEMITEHARRS